LLNALVGERLAPTDAGECTRLVSTYRQGTGYQVAAQLKSGRSTALAFTRADGHLAIQLGELSERDIDWLDIAWPASTLAKITLIDTPGLASINDDNSRRTRDFLETDSASSSQADAVLYLMRHVHRSDVEFLDAFMDRSVSAASPVNAVAVLSRADEIGAGRRDAMDSARRIATRYASDPQVRALCSHVVPLAGLLAETGFTWREDEMAVLRSICALAPEQLERMLLSTQEFCSPDIVDVTVEARRDLLDRLGLYGVRLASDAVVSGAITQASLMAQALVKWSGLSDLQSVILEHFGPRARILQARSALVALRSMLPRLRVSHGAVADRVDRAAERIESTAVEFVRMRAAHLVTSGVVGLADGDRDELTRLLLASSTAAALGFGDSSDRAGLEREALALVSKWRLRGATPLADPRYIEVCEVAARLGEALYAETVAGRAT
jgi:Dynamin family